MSLIAIVAEPSVAEQWSAEMQGTGHEVTAYWGSSVTDELFAGKPPEIIVIDITNPDWSESLLISQSRAAWPGCKIIAVVADYAFRESAVYEMGLWEPDQLLLKPLTPRMLTATVTFLWAQLRTEEIRRLVAGKPAEVRPGDNGLRQQDPGEIGNVSELRLSS